jgi:hypothetical protein
MSKAAFSIKAFALYLFVLGPVLIISPNLLLPMFGMQETSEVWIRVIGVSVVNFGILYWVAAGSNARAVFSASLYTRCGVFLCFVGFAVAGLAKPVLILFGGADLAGALWTLGALRADRLAGRR